MTSLIVGILGYCCRVCGNDLQVNRGKTIIGLPSEIDGDQYLPKVVARKWIICPECGSLHGGPYTITKDEIELDTGSST